MKKRIENGEAGNDEEKMWRKLEKFHENEEYIRDVRYVTYTTLTLRNLLKLHLQHLQKPKCMEHMCFTSLRHHRTQHISIRIEA